MQINFFFYFLFLNYANITHDRERKNDLFKHIIVKAHIENPRVYPIFAFDVSHFKRRVGEFSLILITRITTIFSLSNILQFHTILIISLVYIYISWNSEYVANDTIADESFPSSGYLRKNRNPLPSLQRRKFKRGILKKSISSTSTR